MFLEQNTNSTKSFNKELKSFYKQKDVNGFNILHQCCARGSTELLGLALSNEKCAKYLNTKDNYGRTPLFWSFYSGNWQSAIMVMSKGGRLDVQDNVGDSPFHVGVQQDTVETMKTIMFIVLKKDISEEKHLSSLLLQCLKKKNMKGLTAAALAKQIENKEAFSLLMNMEKLCEQRIEAAGSLIKEIEMRSGIYNGKGLSANSNITRARINKFSSQQEKGLVISLEMKDSSLIRVSVPLTQFAFLILEMTQKRIEMTLLKAPKVELFNKSTSQWELTEKTIFTDSLSFFCYLNSSSYLKNLNAYVNSSKSMNEFQNYCYSYIPQDEKVENSSMKKGTTRSRSTSPKSKMSALRMKMSGMNFSSYKMKRPTTSYEEQQRMLFRNTSN